ncbi:MAG: hypothetical protein JKY17_00550 [Magnetovibrio sp.]|nr:hypothetical protein [Magnetovibrio sp.]
MGGIFSSPSPAPMPAQKVLPDPAKEAETARLESIDRRRRGRAGTITTSDRGLLSTNNNAPKKKSLLGE